MNETRYLSLSYSTRNPFMRNTKKEISSSAFSLYYYYFLLLFLHSFIALYQLTKAPSSFSFHPLASSLFRVLPFRLAPLHLLCSRFCSSSFQQGTQSRRRPSFLTLSRSRLYIYSSHHFSYPSKLFFSAVILCSLYFFLFPFYFLFLPYLLKHRDR